jgi:hypothetical protein
VIEEIRDAARNARNFDIDTLLSYPTLFDGGSARKHRFGLASYIFSPSKYW